MRTTEHYNTKIIIQIPLLQIGFLVYNSAIKLKGNDLMIYSASAIIIISIIISTIIIIDRVFCRSALPPLVNN